MTELRNLGLFAGIGGFELGLSWAGIRTAALVEIDPFAQRVLKARFPDAEIHDNVETRRFREGEADVITAGFPCQDVSLAGRGAGLAGERSGLYRHVVRAIRLVRPKFAILENVAALLGRGLGDVLGDLAEIGHDAEWGCVPASSLGAPHHRDRVWIVSHPERSGWEGPLANGRLQGVSGEDQPSHGDAFARARRAMDGDFSDLRERDGLSVSLERERLRLLGNAVVPQIPELIARAILSLETQAPP